MREGCHWIGGKWVPGTGQGFESADPFTGDALWRGRAATGAEVDRAVAAARQALEPWASSPLGFRVECLEAYAAELRRRRAPLAELIARETGKPLWEALAEVDAMVAKVGLSRQAQAERCGEARLDLGGAAGLVRCRPVGVVAVLGPFNLPGHLPNGHLVPALLLGNTVVLKPSEQTPSVAQTMIEAWAVAGLPPGVLNLVHGGAETGQALAAHPGLDGLLFTGSRAAGVALHRALAGRPEVLLALEMGGNNPLVVWGAADLEAAALQTVLSAYVTAGQRCTCARRLVVPQSARGDELVERVAAWARRLRAGAHTDRPEPFLGPVISARAAERLLLAQDELVGRGAVPLLVMEPSPRSGALLTPGLLDVTGVADRGDEELFGPLLQVVRVPHFEAALEEANRTAYGLAAGIFTDDRVVYQVFLAGVRAGVVHWNRTTTGASGRLPFGGLGHSGNHRPAGYAAVDFCSDPVAVVEGGKLAMPAELPPGVAGA